MREAQPTDGATDWRPQRSGGRNRTDTQGEHCVTPTGGKGGTQLYKRADTRPPRPTGGNSGSGYKRTSEPIGRLRSSVFTGADLRLKNTTADRR